MLPLYAQNPHWKEFILNKSEVGFIEKTVEEEWIDSGDTKIHLDIYHCSKEAPTVIYSHGLSTCGRITAPLVLPLYRKNYNVICPDLVGFGMTTIKYGSGTVDQYIQNLLDVVSYAKKRFDGPRFLTGISLGGGLSYYTAACGAEVNAIACLCLMDFTEARIHNQAIFHSLLRPLFSIASRIAPKAYIPMKHFLSLDKLCPEREVVQIFERNPLVIKSYTTKSIYSLMVSKPKIPFERFDRVPIMVLHAEEDQFIPERLSRMNFDRLPGKKEYFSIKNCGHVPVGSEVIESYARALDSWFRSFITLAKT